MRKAQARVTSPMSTVAGLLLVAIVLRISSYDLSVNAQMGPVSEPEIAPETILDIPFSIEGIERILDAFEQREAALIEAERKLENRRQTLNRSKSDILAKIDELENLEARLAATLAIADSGAEDDISYDTKFRRWLSQPHATRSSSCCVKRTGTGHKPCD